MQHYDHWPVHLPVVHCRFCHWSPSLQAATSEQDAKDAVPSLRGTWSCAHSMFLHDCQVRMHALTAHGVPNTTNGYRDAVLAATLHQWPEPLPTAQVVRARLASMKNATADSVFAVGACAVCNREKCESKLRSWIWPSALDESPPTWWMPSKPVADRQTTWRGHLPKWQTAVAHLLSVDKYLRTYFRTAERLQQAHIDEATGRKNVPTVAAVEAWIKRVRHAMCSVSALSPYSSEHHWVVRASTAEHALCRNCCKATSPPRMAFIAACNALNIVIMCWCLAACQALQKPLPTMPEFAMANGIWAGPEPSAFEKLTWIERKILNQYRSYVTLRRVKLDKRKIPKTMTPLTFSGNTIAFPQDPHTGVKALGLLPADLAKQVLVQFGPDTRDVWTTDATYHVDVERLRAAFQWLCEHNFDWLTAAATDAGRVVLHKDLEDLLQSYAADLQDATEGVPKHVQAAASSLTEAQAPVFEQGPADAVDPGELAPEDVDKDEQVQNVDAAVIDEHFSTCPTMAMWGQALQNLKDLHLLQGKAAAADEQDTHTLLHTAVRTLVQASTTMRKLTSDDIKTILQGVQADHAPVLLEMGHGSEPANAFAPNFFQRSFTYLFPYGDASEQEPHRRWAGNPDLCGTRWAKALLQRADSTRWRRSPEFVAVCFSNFLRRALMRSLAAVIKKPWFQASAQRLCSIKAEDLTTAAASLGAAADPRALFRSDKVSGTIKELSMRLQLVQRSVPYTTPFRLHFRRKLMALRIYDGHPIIFWTLNPSDPYHELRVTFATHNRKIGRLFRLDWSDAEKATEYADHLPSRKLHEEVVADPYAAVRFFYAFVHLVMRTLFNVAPSDKTLPPDGIAGDEQGGIAGIVTSYAGVVESQLRTALHFHFLTTILGFRHPEDFLRKMTDNFSDAVNAIWKWIACLEFHSVEAFAAYCDHGPPASMPPNFDASDDASKAAGSAQASPEPESNADAPAMVALQQAPLLQVSPKQAELLGNNTIAKSYRMQAEARGIRKEDVITSTACKGFWKAHKNRPWQSDFMADDTMSSSAWSHKAALEFLCVVKQCGNHTCIPRVCRKGRIGRQGFCRLGFWRWSVRVKNGKCKWKRCHGKAMMRRWEGSGRAPLGVVPPQRGKPLLETTFPCHARFNAAFALGAKCNHDVSVCLHLPLLADMDTATSPEAKLAAAHEAIAEMTRRISNANFYIGGYAAKAQPLMAGLYKAFAQAKRRLDADLAVGKAQPQQDLLDEVAKTVYECKRLLYRLCTTIEKSTCRGLPEMIAYLLGKPEFITSHSFRPLHLHYLKKAIFAILHKLRAPADDVPWESSADGEPMRIVSNEDAGFTTRTTRMDYTFRPRECESWTLYDFVSGTTIYRKAKHDNSNLTFASEVHLHPWDDMCVEHPLASSHRIALLTDKAWRVPILEGALIPAFEEKPVEHALLTMVLFKPWRSIANDLLDTGVTDEELLDKYNQWRDSVTSQAEEAHAAAKLPEPNARAWWAILVHRRLQNLDALTIKLPDEDLHDFDIPPRDDAEFADVVSSADESEDSCFPMHRDADSNDEQSFLQAAAGRGGDFAAVGRAGARTSCAPPVRGSRVLWT